MPFAGSVSHRCQDKALIRKDGIDPDFVYIVKSGNLMLVQVPILSQIMSGRRFVVLVGRDGATLSL